MEAETRGGGRQALLLALVLPAVLLGAMGVKALGAALHVGSTPARPPARSGAGLAADLAHHDVVLFGGRDVRGDLADTWTWDGDRWTLQHPRLSPPAQTDVRLVYDGARGRVLLLGGTVDAGSAAPEALDELWAWDGRDWRPDVDWEPAGSSKDQLVAWDPRHAELVVVADSTTTWEQLPGYRSPPVVCPLGQGHPARNGLPYFVPLCGDAPSPPGRNVTSLHVWTRDARGWLNHGLSSLGGLYTGALMATDAASGSVALIAHHGVEVCAIMTTESDATAGATPVTGATPGVLLGTPPPTKNVSPPTVVGDPPPGCPTPSGTCTRGAAVPVSPANSSPVISEPGPCQEPASHSCAGGLGDLAQWSWDGAGWRPVAATGLPCGLGADELLSDPSTGHLLLRSDTDFWRWDGARWSRLPRIAQFQGRTGVALAADPERHQVLLFGGLRAGMHGNDLWSWDGHGWTQREGTPPPTPVPHGADATSTPRDRAHAIP